MALMLRQVLATALVAAAVMAWWFPAPLLVRAELVDWGRRYEARHAPPETVLGAMAMARAFLHSLAAPVPIAEFIASETAGLTLEASDPAWDAVFEDLAAAQAADRPAVRYAAPSLTPFASLGEAHRYVQRQGPGGIRHLEVRFVPAADFAAQRIPPEAAFPLRAYRPLLAAVIAGALLLAFFGGPRAGRVEGSSAGRGLRWSAVLAVVFSAAALWPFVYRTVGSGFSFASILLGGLALSGALAGVWLFGRQAAILKRMLAGDHLARFTCAAEEWARFVRWNFEQEASEKKALWRVVSAIGLVVGLGFMALMRDEASVWVFGFLMGLMAFLWLLAAGLPRLAWRRHLRGAGEVCVARDGIYLNGSVHTWNGWGSRLDGVEYKRRPLPHLEFVYSYLMVAGRALYFFRQYVVVRVPVPAGQETEAQRVVAALSP